MYCWSKRSLGNLEGIHPSLRKVCDLALQISKHDFTITDGLRTLAKQKEYVASGASQTMNSKHLVGLAIDFVPYYEGSAQPKAPWEIYEAVADAFKAAANQLGIRITWGGDWKRFKDGCHIELA